MAVIVLGASVKVRIGTGIVPLIVVSNGTFIEDMRRVDPWPSKNESN